VPWLRRLVTGLSPRRPGFDPRSVSEGFVVDKLELRQVFPRVLGFPLSVSFHRCSITRKNEKTNHLHYRVAHQASRLLCVRSICCGHFTVNKIITYVQTACRQASQLLNILRNTRPKTCKMFEMTHQIVSLISAYADF
jgi:hypothetical protein